MDNAVGRGALAKITLRLVAFAWVLYTVEFWDRVNAGFATLQMNEDLGFSDTSWLSP